MEGGIPLNYSVSSFARIMKVGQGAIRYWLKMGYIPGAFRQGTHWRIPEEATTMTRPKVGRPFGKPRGPYRIKKTLEVEELKAQLVDLKEQLKTALAEAEDSRRQYEGMFVEYQELADRYDQLLMGGPPLKESQC